MLDVSNNNQINWKEQLERLIKFVEVDYGCKVSRDNGLEDAAYPTKNIINLNKSHNDELATYYLLHEVGHIIQQKKTVSYQKRFGAVFEGFSRSSKTRKVVCLGEEYDAWDNGLLLAEDLEIPINRKRFEILKTQCLLTYIRWAGNSSSTNSHGQQYSKLSSEQQFSNDNTNNNNNNNS